MLTLLWLIPTIPLISFLILAIFGPRLARPVVATLGAGSIGLAALVTALAGFGLYQLPVAQRAYTQVLWTWMDVAGFTPQIAFRLDALSLLMITVVTFVGFLIHLYSAEFMEDEEGYSRFFAYMNLFVASMLVLVLADNLLLLYLGWEGVGLCSFLLIGFWYKDPANGEAARKAFIVTRIGDTAMAVGLFLLFTRLGTLNIQALMQRATQQWPPGSHWAVAAATLLLIGGMGKSAQLPLQTWLPDAMAGPTPVSALIHAATMVTAGVYLLARTHVLFALAPAVMTAVAVIGTITLLVAGFSALTQSDIKRVLAYSTISQLGYMFLALGVGAWSAAMFHFMTHAFFKALLFLGAGAISFSLHHEHNIFKMGGLRRQLPVTFWTFLIGSASLAALPLITAGFYSKDLILAEAWTSSQGSFWLWLGGLVGAFLTALYTFRLVFITFFGEAKMQADHIPGIRIHLPLIILAVLSIIGGFVETPRTLGGISIFPNFIESVLPRTALEATATNRELISEVVAAVVALVGIYVAYLFYVQRPQLAAQIVAPTWAATLHRFWYSGWGFDWLYNKLFVQPYVWLARTDQDDVIDWLPRGLAWLTQRFNQALSYTQSGRVRWYAMGIAVGAVILLTIVVVL